MSKTTNSYMSNFFTTTVDNLLESVKSGIIPKEEVMPIIRELAKISDLFTIFIDKALKEDEIQYLLLECMGIEKDDVDKASKELEKILEANKENNLEEKEIEYLDSDDVTTTFKTYTDKEDYPKAEELLYKFLIGLGCKDVVEAFKSVPR